MSINWKTERLGKTVREIKKVETAFDLAENKDIKGNVRLFCHGVPVKWKHVRLLRFFNNDLSRIRQHDTAKMYYDFTSFSCNPYTATLSKYWKKANEKRRKHNKAEWNTSNLAESRQEKVQFMLFAINFRLVVTTNKLPRGILIKKK